MMKVGAVWAKEKDGRPYLSGPIQLDADVVLRDGQQIVLFPPREARDNGPAWEVLISKPKPKTDAAPAKKTDDDIPF